MARAEGKPKGRPKGTPNTPVSVRTAAVASYKARGRGVTSEQVAQRFNVAESSVRAWAAKADGTESAQLVFGENTVYVKAPRNTPAMVWLREYYATHQQLPPTADVMAVMARDCGEGERQLSYNTRYKQANRLKQAVLRDVNQYNHISRSIGIERIPPGKTSRSCRCVLDCDEGCRTREQMIECVNETCRVGSKCSNRVLQREPTVKLERRPIPGSGDGMFAAEDIARGSFIREYVGRVIDRAAYTKLKAFGRGTYVMELANGFYVDAMHCGNESRLFNHSHSPNCRAELWWVRGEPRVGIFAARKIKLGTQVTINYGTNYYIATCNCVPCNRKRQEKKSPPTSI